MQQEVQYALHETGSFHISLAFRFAIPFRFSAGWARSGRTKKDSLSNLFRMAKEEIVTVIGGVPSDSPQNGQGAVVLRRIPFIFSCEWQRGGCRSKGISFRFSSELKGDPLAMATSQNTRVSYYPLDNTIAHWARQINYLILR